MASIRNDMDDIVHQLCTNAEFNADDMRVAIKSGDTDAARIAALNMLERVAAARGVVSLGHAQGATTTGASHQIGKLRTAEDRAWTLLTGVK
jgi:hypothetical protein